MSTIIILMIVFLLTYMGMPLKVRIFLFVANLFIPDPIPYVDEIIMFALLFKPDKNTKNK